MQFPSGTVHLAIVDPGVGTDRSILAAEVAGQFLVLPDNGLISDLLIQAPAARLHRVAAPELWNSPISSTFHGRDIMASSPPFWPAAERCPRLDRSCNSACGYPAAACRSAVRWQLVVQHCRARPLRQPPIDQLPRARRGVGLRAGRGDPATRRGLAAASLRDNLRPGRGGPAGAAARFARPFGTGCGGWISGKPANHRRRRPGEDSTCCLAHHPRLATNFCILVQSRPGSVPWAGSSLTWPDRVVAASPACDRCRSPRVLKARM